jgi:hypothetical protein
MAYVFIFGASAPRGPGPSHSWGFLITHNDASQSVGLLWTCDQPDAETSTRQHTTLTTDIHTPGGIRTRSLSRRAAVDLMLKGYINFKLRYALNVTRTLQLSADWPHALLQVHSTRDLLPADTF